MSTVNEARAAVTTDRGARAGIGMTIAFVGASVALTVPGRAVDWHGFHAASTIYPWWVWGVIAIGLVASLVSINVSRGNAGAASFSSGVALVSAGALLGTAIVGRVHIEPATGMVGGYGKVSTIQDAAVVISCLALVAAVLAVAQLVARRDIPVQVPTYVRVACVILGVALIVAVPLAIAWIDPDARDLTSGGAIGLFYAGPWGVSVVLAGWLSKPAASGVLAAVVLLVMAALAGPQMKSLVFHDPRGIFAVCLVASLVTLAMRLSARDEGMPVG